MVGAWGRGGGTERGAERDELNDDGFSPLALAARHGQWAAFEQAHTHGRARANTHTHTQ